MDSLRADLVLPKDRLFIQPSLISDRRETSGGNQLGGRQRDPALAQGQVCHVTQAQESVTKTSSAACAFDEADEVAHRKALSV